MAVLFTEEGCFHIRGQEAEIEVIITKKDSNDTDLITIEQDPPDITQTGFEDAGGPGVEEGVVHSKGVVEGTGRREITAKVASHQNPLVSKSER